MYFHYKNGDFFNKAQTACFIKRMKSEGKTVRISIEIFLQKYSENK